MHWFDWCEAYSKAWFAWFYSFLASLSLSSSYWMNEFLWFIKDVSWQFSIFNSSIALNRLDFSPLILFIIFSSLSSFSILPLCSISNVSIYNFCFLFSCFSISSSSLYFIFSLLMISKSVSCCVCWWSWDSSYWSIISFRSIVCSIVLIEISFSSIMLSRFVISCYFRNSYD